MSDEESVYRDIELGGNLRSHLARDILYPENTPIGWTPTAFDDVPQLPRVE
jgi:hypothetical protein